MNKLVEKLILKEGIKSNIEIENLKILIKENTPSNFNIEWLSELEFKFLSKFSLGTLQMKGNPGAIEGIKGYAEIFNINGKAKIIIKTKIRSELYIFGVLSLLLPIIFILSENEEFPLWVYFLMPLVFFWFRFMYRLQEKRLFNLIREYINNLE